MSELVDEVVKLLNLPQMRALSVIVAAISLFFSAASLWKIWRVTKAQERYFDADQARFIQGVWQQTNAVVLSDQKHVETMTKLCCYEDEEDTLKSYMVYNQLNPAYTAFYTCRSTINDKIYRKNLDFTLKTFEKSSRDLLKRTLDERGYDKAFVADCKKCLADIEKKEKTGLSAHIAASQFDGSALTPTVTP